ncbi:MAG TPA: hypothetical protein VMZ91_16185, partial [Candidatus Paceibacterota bacterium]|nr:hypothetical protein [Candidatus Paceibacterota bacterium]
IKKEVILMSQDFKDELKELKKEEVEGKEEKLSYFEYWLLMGMEELLEKVDSIDVEITAIKEIIKIK